MIWLSASGNAADTDVVESGAPAPDTLRVPADTVPIPLMEERLVLEESADTSGGRESLEGLIRCYEALGCAEQADIYREELRGREDCQ